MSNPGRGSTYQLARCLHRCSACSPRPVRVGQTINARAQTRGEVLRRPNNAKVRTQALELVPELLYESWIICGLVLRSHNDQYSSIACFHPRPNTKASRRDAEAVATTSTCSAFQDLYSATNRSIFCIKCLHTSCDDWIHTDDDALLQTGSNRFWVDRR